MIKLKSTVTISNCFNLDPYNKSNYKNPNQRAYGTRLTSPNLFKQQIKSSTSFVRSSCKTQNVSKVKCFTQRLENKTEERERIGKTVRYLTSFKSVRLLSLRTVQILNFMVHHIYVYTALCSSHSEEYTHQPKEKTLNISYVCVCVCVATEQGKVCE